MTINVDLSESSINAAIRRLGQVKQNLDYGLQQTLEILVKNGAETAQAADGDMATVAGYMDSDKLGYIVATGDAPIIAEFGAGDATLKPEQYFTYMPQTPVYPGSYSESEYGTRQYAEYGWWKFGNNIYTEVKPRQGLYKAKQRILNEYADIAKGVIKL